MRHNSNGLFPILSNKDSWENRVMTYGNTSAQVNMLLVLSSRKIIEVVMQEASHMPTLLIENKTEMYGFWSITD